MPIPSSMLNLWTGYASSPDDWRQAFEANPEVSSRFVTNILNFFKCVMCKGRQEEFKYLIDWLASTIQYPGKKLRVGVVAVGPEGCGKDFILARLYTRAYGTNFKRCHDVRDFSGQFTNFRETVFCIIDELPPDLNNQIQSRLKALITDEEQRSEEKYGHAEYLHGCSNFYVTSNVYKTMFHVSNESRRWFFVNIDTAIMADDSRHSFFSDTIKMFDAGNGIDMLLWYLYGIYKVDENWNASPVLSTESLKFQKEMQWSSSHYFLLDSLKEKRFGYCSSALEWKDLSKPLKCPADDLFSAYCNWCIQHKEKQETHNEFFHLLSQLLNMSGIQRCAGRNYWNTGANWYNLAYFFHLNTTHEIATEEELRNYVPQPIQNSIFNNLDSQDLYAENSFPDPTSYFGIAALFQSDSQKSEDEECLQLPDSPRGTSFL